MALIKCPECGRENVSDTAIACPGCGYGVKEHFDRIGRETKKQENIEIKEDDIKPPIVNKDESDKKQEPLQNASNKNILYGVCAVLAIIFVIVYIAVTVSENEKKENEKNVLWTVVIIIKWKAANIVKYTHV